MRNLGARLFVLLCALSARAEAQPRVLELRVVGSAADAAAQVGVVEELLGRIDVAVRVTAIGRVDLAEVMLVPSVVDASAAAWAWLDLSSPERAQVFLTDARRDRILVRSLPLSQGLDEVAREEVGHILATGVDALLSGETIGQSRAELESSLGGAAHAPPPPSRPRVAFRGGLHYQAGVYAEGAIVLHGPGVGVEAEWRRLHAAFLVGWHFDVEEVRAGVGARLRGGELRWLGGVSLPVGKRIAVVPAVGLGLDVVHLQPLQRSGRDFDLTEARLTVVPMATARATLRFALVSDLFVSLAFAADIEIEDARYTVRRDGQEDVVLDPWLVRPSLAVAFVFEP